MKQKAGDVSGQVILVCKLMGTIMGVVLAVFESLGRDFQGGAIRGGPTNILIPGNNNLRT